MATFEISGGRLTIDGWLDTETERDLRDSCTALLSSTEDTVTLDLTKVERINSVSIGVLVALMMDLRQVSKRAILQPSPSLKRVLDMTGLTDTFARAAKPVSKPKPKSRKAQF
jgi:anti-anti-sigma factor